jgi:uncharacterized protein with HEPN domain
MWKDDAFAADILLAASDIQRFTAGLTRDQFLNNDVVHSAVIQRIIVLGEAAKRLSEEFRQKHSQIQWRQVAGMRDRCVHGYDNIDLELVWEVVTTHAPALERYLKTVLTPPPENP